MKSSRIIFLLPLLSLFITSCEEKDEHQEGTVQEVGNNDSIPGKNETVTLSGSVSVNGTLTGAPGSSLYLYKYGTNPPITVDSTTVGQDGSFSLDFPQNGYSFMGIGNQMNNVALILVAPGDEITISGDAANLGMGYEVSGTGLSKDLKRYLKLKNEFSQKINAANQELAQLAPNDSKGKEAVTQKGLALQEEFIEKRDAFIQEMDDTPVLYIALQDIFDPVKDIEKIKSIAKATNKYLPNSIFAQQANDVLTQAEQQIEVSEQMSNIDPSAVAIGKPAPELNFSNPEGQKIALSSLKGKVVLLDFWASWCGPCRMENPNVVKLYNQYKDKGFTVYSVSLDNNKTKWVNAIQADGLAWPNHVSDLGGWNSLGAAIYGVNSIPQTYLIDANGTIIASGLRGEELAKKLKELLG